MLSTRSAVTAARLRRAEWLPPLLPDCAALFLDFDGTLTSLAPRPDLVSVARPLPGLLGRLRLRLQGALAVLSGRPLLTLDALLAPERLPGAGVHGAELRSADGFTSAPPNPPAVMELAGRLQHKFGGDPRILIENKGAAVALHYRQAPECMLECTLAMQTLVSAYPHLELLHGRMVIEARLCGIGKGQALQRLMVKAPFAGRQPIVLGDDYGDEEAFAAAQARGGYGIKVGPGRSCAEYRLQSVRRVHAWLHESARHLGQP